MSICSYLLIYSFRLVSEAGNAFILQANVLIKAGEKDEAATAYLNASKSFKKSNPKGE
jgi:hypothetical protein